MSHSLLYASAIPSDRRMWNTRPSSPLRSRTTYPRPSSLLILAVTVGFVTQASSASLEAVTEPSPAMMLRYSTSL